MPPRGGATRSARALLDRGGPLAARLPGYERREGQLRMAEAVEEALLAGDHLLVEAGTGVGKTLAYLLPAARLGAPVVISTGTRNLQDQIFRKDIPLLRDRLGLDIRATYLKGRDNYLCLHRMRDFGRAPSFPDRSEARFFQAVTDWAGATSTGDRAELAEMPEGVSFWRDVNAKADTCLGRRCVDYEECFLVRMRREAAESDIVVVNHHLLLADLAVKATEFGAILPEYRHVIIDEAHLLEDVATSYFGRRVSRFRCRELAEDTARFLAQAGAHDEGMLRLVASTGDAAHDLFDSFRGEAGRQRLRAALWTPVRLEARERLLRSVKELEAALATLREPTEDLLSARRRAGEIASDLEFTLHDEDPDHVRWVDPSDRGPSFHAAPIDVAASLQEHLFSRVASAVLTSATLTVAGEFDFIRQRLGLARARALSVSSPFDYSRQAVLYLPSDLPPRDSRQFYPAAAAHVRELLELTGGRAFLLFTSYAGLHRMRQLLDDSPHDFALLMQGDAPRHALLERFRHGRRAVLLATASFWQGVDVPGQALGLVVIDRLPFEVPSDPVVEARAHRLRQEGENPFLRYQLPQAVIGLKQGAGRLIRTTSDRGVLVLLDPRVRSRAYGPAFLESLPPFARAESLDDVRRFLAATQA